jgi:hypothetical protein
MKNDRDETRISQALRLLRHDVEVPALEPARERALLAAFDARWARARPGGWWRKSPRVASVGRRAWMTAAAASIVIAITLDWLVVKNAPGSGARPDAIVDMADFVPWPGSQAWPPFESGELMRVDLPVSALPGLGLWPPSSAASVVEADIVVGQDGFARAVRLVQ